MNFKLNDENRQSIADRFLDKNDLEFNCITKYTSSNANSFKVQVLFEDSFSNLQVLDTVLYHGVKHFIQNSYMTPENKLTILLGLASNRKKFFEVSFNIFTNPVLKTSFVFNTKTNRSDLTQEVFSYLKMDINSNRNNPLRQTIDELVMNAQLNAPKASLQKNVIDSILIIEKTDLLIAATVIDSYGTLDCKKFLKKIENCLKFGKAESINYGRGGAGLGSTILYDHSDFIMLGCDSLKKTRFTCVLPLNISEQNLSYTQKSISIID